MVAAQSYGIGSCYIGDVMENMEELRSLLDLPEYVFPAALLVFGYPTEQQKAREKPRRFDLRHIVHENAYREADRAELREMFADRAGVQGFEKWTQAFCARKYESDFSKEMSRSVRKWINELELSGES